MLVDTVQIHATDRRLAGKPITLRYLYVDSQGVPSDAPSTVTVAATDIGGTPVTTGAVVEVSRDNDDRPKIYTAPITAANAPTTPDLLSVVWSVASAGTETRHVEIVNDFYFDLADWRRYRDRSGSSSSRSSGASDDQVVQARLRAEQECERITGRSFVRRARAVRVPAPTHATARLIVPDADLVSITSVVSVDGAATYSAAQLANLQPTSGAMFVRRDGSVWTEAPDWLDVLYVYGTLRPPEEIKGAVMRRCAYWLTQSDTGVPDWATSSSPEGSGLTFRVGEDSRTSGKTGDPVVNAIYGRYGRETTAIVA